jgi:hypothetical protein
LQRPIIMQTPKTLDGHFSPAVSLADFVRIFPSSSKAFQRQGTKLPPSRFVLFARNRAMQVSSAVSFIRSSSRKPRQSTKKSDGEILSKSWKSPSTFRDLRGPLPGCQTCEALRDLLRRTGILVLRRPRSIRGGCPSSCVPAFAYPGHTVIAAILCMSKGLLHNCPFSILLVMCTSTCLFVFA